VTRPLVSLRRAVALGAAASATTRAPITASFWWFLVLGVWYAGDAGPAMPAMAFTAVVLFPTSTWVAHGHATALSDDLRAVLTAACGQRRALAVDGWPPALWAVAASALAVAANWAFDPHPVPLAHRGLGLALQLATATCGAALGLAAHAWRLTRAVTTLLACAATGLSLVVAAVPPVGPVQAAWGDSGTSSLAWQLWSILGPAVMVVALLSVTIRARRRRL
jgi:hypothetical protein